MAPASSASKPSVIAEAHTGQLWGLLFLTHPDGLGEYWTLFWLPDSHDLYSFIVTSSSGQQMVKLSQN